jgi:NDP-4-keto-2,6-dideoxyhexose 3-C-methyltransferase
MYTQISSCRICGNSNLVQVLDLGIQTLTGVFPRQRDQTVTSGPLRLVKCTGSEDVCGLLQLAHSYDLAEMYGDNYGYRSGLNESMVRHLASKVERVRSIVNLSENDIVLDIGSNDGTTLSFYPYDACRKIGIDPTAGKFREFYHPDIVVVEDFFSAARFREVFPSESARVVTSFSMFYDLERPLQFVREVADILDQDGVWVFEQSYMPLMLEMNSYDTVCHEHLEYYSLKQIQWMLSRSGLKIIDVEFNDVNGGSFSVTAAKADSVHQQFEELEALLSIERQRGLDGLEPFIEFERRAQASRESLRAFVTGERELGKSISALGASTKGNVILQFCGFDSNDIKVIGEVNPDKYGAYAPGSLIPIAEENDVLAEKPDYLIVLPWHFREHFINAYAGRASKLVFPLPVLEVVELP